MLSEKLSFKEKEDVYRFILSQAEALIDEECDLIGNLANISAILFHNLRNINWAGFYLLKNDVLHLGPFQGEVACTRIQVGQGVCGTSVKYKATVVVPNVHEFEGHIACSALSNSEIVVPFYLNDQIAGVLDIDSTAFNSFDDTDKYYLEKLVRFIK